MGDKTMAANNRAIQTTIDTTLKTLAINTDIGEIFIRLSDLDPEILEYAALHGLKQKIVDAAALPNGATITEKFAAMQEVYGRLTNKEEPTWNKGAGAGNGGTGGLLFRALCRLYPTKTPDAIKGYLDKQDNKKQAALRKDPKVSAMIETVRAEGIKTTGIDAGELLNELDEI
jgi:hypothetical protein